MKVLLDVTISPNGMIARENGMEDWLPHEGWQEFLDEAKKYNNIVMGRETYEIVTKYYEDENFDDVDVVLKVIVSRSQNFKTPDGYVLAKSPEEAISIVKQHGINTLYLIGGGKLNGAFMKKGLVDQVHLTVNPYIIGIGRPFVGYEDFDLPLELVGSEKLSGGRIFIRYRVINDKIGKDD